MKRMLMFMLAVAMSLGLAACSGCSTTGADGTTKPVTQGQKIEYTCSTAMAGIELGTMMAKQGKLKYEQYKLVVEAGDFLLPICSANPRPTLDKVKMAAVEQAAARILFLVTPKSGGVK